jgi:hypothetical protein
MQEMDNGVLLARQCELEGFVFSSPSARRPKTLADGSENFAGYSAVCGGARHSGGRVNVLIMVDAAQQRGEKDA